MTFIKRDSNLENDSWSLRLIAIIKNIKNLIRFISTYRYRQR